MKYGKNVNVIKILGGGGLHLHRVIMDKVVCLKYGKKKEVASMKKHPFLE